MWKPKLKPEFRVPVSDGERNGFPPRVSASGAWWSTPPSSGTPPTQRPPFASGSNPYSPGLLKPLRARVHEAAFPRRGHVRLKAREIGAVWVPRKPDRSVRRHGAVECIVIGEAVGFAVVHQAPFFVAIKSRQGGKPQRSVWSWSNSLHRCRRRVLAASHSSEGKASRIKPGHASAAIPYPHEALRGRVYGGDNIVNRAFRRGSRSRRSPSYRDTAIVGYAVLQPQLPSGATWSASWFASRPTPATSTAFVPSMRQSPARWVTVHTRPWRSTARVLEVDIFQVPDAGDGLKPLAVEAAQPLLVRSQSIPSGVASISNTRPALRPLVPLGKFWKRPVAGSNREAPFSVPNHSAPSGSAWMQNTRLSRSPSRSDKLVNLSPSKRETPACVASQRVPSGAKWRS